MKEGWYIFASLEKGDAHFVFVGGGEGEALKACTMKGVNVPSLTPWAVARDVGNVPLCELCKRFLNPPTKEKDARS